MLNNAQLIINSKNIKYQFLFVSLISPFTINKLRFSHISNINKKKVFIKQSYMILVWFYYLSFLNRRSSDDYRLNVASLPITKRIFTTTKAPMAHKTRSKEQYQFKFYKFKISFNATLIEKYTFLNSLDSALLAILINKKNLPQLETNLLFLKSLTFLIHTRDVNYFNYNFFSKQSY